MNIHSTNKTPTQITTHTHPPNQPFIQLKNPTNQPTHSLNNHPSSTFAHESTNKPTNQPTKQTNKQTSIKPIKQTTSHPSNQLTNERTNEPTNQPNKQTRQQINKRFINISLLFLIHQSIQPTYQPTNIPTSQTFINISLLLSPNPPTNQLTNQWNDQPTTIILK